MQPHWISLVDRLPKTDQVVDLLVVSSRVAAASEIGYAKGVLSQKGWVFTKEPPYTEIVAWLECDGRPLTQDEISNIPKDQIRF